MLFMKNIKILLLLAISINCYGQDTLYVMKDGYPIYQRAVSDIDSVQTISSDSYEKIQDIDGNSYEVAVVGNKMWLAENLRVSKFSNGDDASYQLDTDNPENGYYYKLSVARDSRNVCPNGWHLSTGGDWSGMGTTDVLKSTTTWDTGTISTTNLSGFNAKSSGFYGPEGGYGNFNGGELVPPDTTKKFRKQGTTAYFWTPEYVGSSGGLVSCFAAYVLKKISGENGNVGHAYYGTSCDGEKFWGDLASVRCVRDAEWIPDSINIMHEGQSLFRKSVNDFDSIMFQSPILTAFITEEIKETGGISALVKFEVDNFSAVTAMGICWGKNPNPTTSDMHKPLHMYQNDRNARIASLDTNTTYYVRGYVTDATGTHFGNELNFTTSGLGTTDSIVDHTGKKYPMVMIGNQIWMTTNLEATQYPDGTIIPLIETYSTAVGYARGTDGHFYAPAVVYTNDRDACPVGTHTPTKNEYKTLITQLGGEDLAGTKVKSTTGWTGGNGTNSSGFNAIATGFWRNSALVNPGGYALFLNKNYESSSSSTNTAYLWYGDHTFVEYGGSTSNGKYSIRCIKN